MELKGVSPTDEDDITLRLEDVDFHMLSETEGELRATLTMEAAGRRQETAELVTEAVWNEVEDGKTAAGAVIYVVQKGDSLWKIAKKYRTTVDNIVAVNEIEDPELIYPGQKLLIIKMKR
jgi:nucleoid-associated protein YgaU